LLPLEPTDFLGNFDNGNKTKTIANLDQKIRRIPSKTVLRLNRLFNFLVRIDVLHLKNLYSIATELMIHRSAAAPTMKAEEAD